MKKNACRILTALLAVLCLFSAVSCTGSGSTEKEKTTEGKNDWQPAEGEIGAKLLSASYERARPLAEYPYQRPVPETDFTDALNGFSFDLFRACLAAGGNEDGNNELLSPLSAALCLTLVENGAAGKTLAEMEKTFGMPLDKWRAALAELADLLPAFCENGKVQTANSIWVREDFTPLVKPAFLQENADYFDAQVFSAPFDLTLPKDINKWAYDRTDGLIRELMNETETPDPSAVMFLLNALLFEMPWEKAVEDAQVREERFTNADGTKVKVDMLRFEEGGYLTGDTAIGFTKSYADSRYEFVALLPTGKNTVDDVIASLNAESWKNLLASGKEARVTCVMPEFSYNGRYGLKEPLKSLGTVSAFGNADFSGIADAGLYISDAFQKTRIELTRTGTRAAAVTVVEMRKFAMEPEGKEVEIRLDRPFVYLIVNTMTGTPLFIGTVNEL